MNRKINKIKLYVKQTNKAQELAKILKQKLINTNIKIVNRNYDLAISIGGDGTFLKMIHENNFNQDIYYVGINAGSLGYLIDIDSNNIDEFIDSIKNNIFKEKKYNILKTNITTSKEKYEMSSFNELIIKKINQTVLKTDVYVDDELLEHFKGDGLLISTPSGSTAYNLSFGGPIIDNQINAIVMTPIAPINSSLFNNLRNSMVINNKRKIIINPDKKTNLCLLNDGKVINYNNVLDINIYLSSDVITLLSLKDNYIKRINSKIIGNQKNV